MIKLKFVFFTITLIDTLLCNGQNTDITETDDFFIRPYNHLSYYYPNSNDSYAHDHLDFHDHSAAEFQQELTDHFGRYEVGGVDLTAIYVKSNNFKYEWQFSSLIRNPSEWRNWVSYKDDQNSTKFIQSMFTGNVLYKSFDGDETPDADPAKSVFPILFEDNLQIVSHLNRIFSDDGEEQTRQNSKIVDYRKRVNNSAIGYELILVWHKTFRTCYLEYSDRSGLQLEIRDVKINKCTFSEESFPVDRSDRVWKDSVIMRRMREKKQKSLDFFMQSSSDLFLGLPNLY